MQLAITTPIAQPTPALPPAIAQVQLLEATYSFTGGTITLIWNELDGYGNLIDSQNQMLSADQTTAFFATSIAGMPDLLTAFQAAFLTTVTAMYGACSVVSP